MSRSSWTRVVRLLVLAVAAAALVFGLTMSAFTVHAAPTGDPVLDAVIREICGLHPHSHSVLSSIATLIGAGGVLNLLIAALIALTSIAVPVVKLVLLAMISWIPPHRKFAALRVLAVVAPWATLEPLCAGVMMVAASAAGARIDLGAAIPALIIAALLPILVTVFFQEHRKTSLQTIESAAAV